MAKSSFINKHNFAYKLCLFILFSLLSIVCSNNTYAHQAPYSVAYLDISPNKVVMELHIPLSELELAVGYRLSENPETLYEEKKDQLKSYILQHTQAFIKGAKPWSVDLNNLELIKDEQVTSGPAFWELKAYLTLIPPIGENTRHFFLHYDGVVHQVANHIIFVVVRNDWETGRSDSLTAESNPMNIRIGGDNLVHPLEINLDEGSNWTGFKNIFELGMRHIKDGTDHLMFLLVLLLPSPLIVRKKKWSTFGGVSFSLKALLKIITAFTIGHSITLLLGAAGWFIAPSQIIEILIAVSILISAIHAITPLFPGKEFFISGGFGLIHGMAFASVLSEMNLSGSSLALSILGFNIGIEVMQLLVVLIVFPWLILLSRTKHYKYFRIAGAVLAITSSIAWILERSTGTPNFLTEFIANEYTHAIWLIIALAVSSIALYYLNKKNNIHRKVYSSNI
ncbi:HupE/UreJ family protein [Rhizosphaericola mali]|uniref:HupE/UreJ family protein n=1 Tax=Rhizosphaericola mali TaxID=2545455 RepID=A0A5P2FZ03_9BACT|nr:HupE/UreJ family protein [Rhizosphaericola mali]QES88157.1 HupE/UreJ family protein [Rhizosphaericola mali]